MEWILGINLAKLPNISLQEPLSSENRCCFLLNLSLDQMAQYSVELFPILYQQSHLAVSGPMSQTTFSKTESPLYTMCTSSLLIFIIHGSQKDNLEVPNGAHRVGGGWTLVPFFTYYSIIHYILNLHLSFSKVPGTYPSSKFSCYGPYDNELGNKSIPM